MKRALFVIAVLLVSSMTFLVVLGRSDRADDLPDGCEREFARDGTDAVRRCQTAVILADHEARERDRMERATR